MTSYVKFLKGNKEAYDKLSCKQEDTLYFIYDKDATQGKLYLGNILISDGPITDVSDVVDNLSLAKAEDKTLYLKNYGKKWFERIQGKWVPHSASEEYPWRENLQPRVYYDEEQKGYVLGWFLLPQQLEELTEKIDTIPDLVSDELGSRKLLSYKVVADKKEIDVTAKNADLFIYLVGDGLKQYSEYMVINEKLEKIGDWELDLEPYAKRDEVEDALAPLRKSAEQNAANIKILNTNLLGLDFKIDEQAETLQRLNENIKNLNSSTDEVKTQIDEIEKRTIWTKI